MNYTNPDSNQLSLEQFKEYHAAHSNKPSYDVWEAKYNINSAVHELRENVQAAPNFGGGPGHSGDVKIKVGPTQQNYPNNLHFHVEKMQKE